MVEVAVTLLVLAALTVGLVRAGTGYVAWHGCGFGPLAAVEETVGHFGGGPSWLECVASPTGGSAPGSPH